MNGLNILLVEDDPTTALVISDLLAAHGYQTQLARNGKEALEKYQARRPDLAIVDVQLPLKSGFEVCHAIKTESVGQPCPVVLMSAVYTDERRAVPYALEGLHADAYLVKPFSLEVLLANVKHLLPRRPLVH